MASTKTSVVPKKSVAPKKPAAAQKSIAPQKQVASQQSVAPQKPLASQKSIAPKKSVAPKPKPAGPGVCICGAQGKTLLAKVVSQMTPEGTVAAEPLAFEVQFCPSCTGRIRAGKEIAI
jgi:hypothetical protein